MHDEPEYIEEVELEGGTPVPHGPTLSTHSPQASTGGAGFSRLSAVEGGAARPASRLTTWCRAQCSKWVTVW
jgi:hypothetical protein